jgi:D-alanyl-D-alanine carboxypeptidase
MSKKPHRTIIRSAAVAIALLLASCASNHQAAPTAGRQASSGSWDAHMQEASARFDIPVSWIKAVVRQESGGRTHDSKGRPLRSSAGAIGLMQLMPDTYRLMKDRYGLGPDPDDPRDNIMAGTAYMREMYDLFGNPGFLAAYNCGPGCYGDHLAGRRGLPGETRRYLSSVAPLLKAENPTRTVVASLEPSVPNAASAGAPRPAVVRSELATPVQVPTSPPVMPAPVLGRPSAQHIGSTRLGDKPRAPDGIAGSGSWGIQVGAFRTLADSRKAAETAMKRSPDLLRGARIRVAEVSAGAETLYRAQVVGISEAGSTEACKRLVSAGKACVRVVGS